MSTAWLVTGARGQLGHDLIEVLDGRGDAVTAVGRQEMDLTDEASVRDVVRTWLASPGDRHVLVNAAAYTAVDAAETDEDTALVVNGHAPGWMAQELAGRGWVPPWLSMWAANILFGAAGLYLAVRMGSESGSARGGGVREWWEQWRWRRQTRRDARRAAAAGARTPLQAS